MDENIDRDIGRMTFLSKKHPQADAFKYVIKLKDEIHVNQVSGKIDTAAAGERELPYGLHR